MSKSISKRVKSALAALMVAATLLTGAGVAHAGNSFTGYSTSVGAFNGSGYTGGQTKATTNRAGALRSVAVGGRYTVDARMQRTNGDNSGPWVRKVNSGQTRGLPNKLPAQSRARVHFSNNWSTPVRVQVEGSWRSR